MDQADWLRSTNPVEMLTHLMTNCDLSDRKLRLFACACCRAGWSNLSDDGRRVTEIAERYADGLASESELGQGRVDGRHDDWTTYFCCLDLNRIKHIKQEDVSLWFEFLRRTQGLIVGAPVPREPKLNCIQADLLRDVFGNPFRVIGTHRLMETKTAKEAGRGVFLFGELKVEPLPWLTWNDGAILKLAQIMYDSRDFTDMPILGDMLYEAGCEDKCVLDHCTYICRNAFHVLDGDKAYVCAMCGNQSSMYGHNYGKCPRCPECGKFKSVPTLHVRGCYVLDAILGGR